MLFQSYWRHILKKELKSYLETISNSRGNEFSELYSHLRKSIGDEFVEVLDGDMIRFEVPLKLYPKTYNKKPLMFASLANRKANITLTLTALYSDSKLKKEFIEECSKIAPKLVTKTNCIKVKTVEELPMKTILKFLKKLNYKKFITNYENIIKP